MKEETRKAPWVCPWTGKQEFTFAPDFSGIDPDTGEPWSPRKVVEILGLKVSSDTETRAACEKVLAAHPDKVASYKAGKTQLIGFFMKHVMEETQKRAAPRDATRILNELMGG